MVVVRYAPSPTGMQHIGGLRTALYNYLLARSKRGKFILRIEDTDRKRFAAEALEDIYASLSWLGIDWDEGPDIGGEHGPYLQSERLDIYNKHIQTLIENGTAYESFETLEGESDTKRLVRLNMPKDGSVQVHDIVLGDIEFKYQDLPKDPVLIKSDGYPTYHFANVVDDHCMEVTHVLRSQEWISSVAMHAHIYTAFGWQTPAFCHLPYVSAVDGKKLSKRHGAVSVHEFRQAGYLPEAMMNYLALLGWAYDDKREMFSADDLKKLFTLDGLNKAPAVFDNDRLNWFNRQYIKELAPEVLISAIQNSIGQDRSVAERLVPLLRERLTTLSDIPELTNFIFHSDGQFTDAASYIPPKTSAEEVLDILKSVEDIIENSNLDDSNGMEAKLRGWAEEHHIKNKQLFMSIRLALSWSPVSLPLLPVLPIMGKEEALRRIAYARRSIEGN